jgi:hypothetical protein
MSVLRTRCLQRADMAVGTTQTDKSVDTNEVNGLMSEKYGELYEAVSQGDRYFETSETVTTTGTNTIAEPVDILSLVDTIERIYDTVSGKVHRLRRIEPQERAYWKGRTGHARAWEFADDTIYLYPTPPANDQYIIRYIPQPPDLTTYLDTDTVDVVCPAGEAYLIWGVAGLLLAKSKSDVTLALAKEKDAFDRLVKWAIDRTQNTPHQQMVEDDYDGWPPLDGSWYYDR